MAKVIFYSTGEIFWVSDPPAGKSHIGVPNVFAAVPPDHLFTYAKVAHALKDAGHSVIGAYGRQRAEVRLRNGEEAIGGPDNQILGLASMDDAESTVLVLIATDSGARPMGSDDFPRIPFSEAEKKALRTFRQRGGGLYVTWDHGQLGYQSLMELDLHGPIAPEPREPHRPNVAFSHDTTDEGLVKTPGFVRRSDGTMEETELWLTVGPPAGYMQKIVPAQVLYKQKLPDGTPTPAPITPHPVFNGVGGHDGIWIPAHMHEGILKGKASLQGIDEEELPEGVKYLAIHVPFTETTFFSYAIMAYKDTGSGSDDDLKGRVIWDTSFHHLVDINWSSDGRVPWDPFVPFSAEALWRQQLPPDLFEERLERGMKRLFVNIVSWLAHDLPASPARQRLQTAAASESARTGYSLSGVVNVSENSIQQSAHENNFPPPEWLGGR